MVLAGCSTHSPAASTRPAIDLVQAGKNIEFPGGYVLRVAKREGDSLEGIHLLAPPTDGQAREITAGEGTIKSGAEGNNFENQITITLRDAKTLAGTTSFTSPWVKIVLHN